MRVDLYVPYANKEEAKRYGARWDSHKRVWYFTDLSSWSRFSRWMQPEDIERCVKHCLEFGKSVASKAPDANTRPVLALSGRQQYLVRKGKRTHLWDGSDTLCRMWSTSGMRKGKYKLSDDPQNKLCSMCVAVAQKGKRPKLRVVGDELDKQAASHIRSIMAE